jgi:hypothetical protein
MLNSVKMKAEALQHVFYRAKDCKESPVNVDHDFQAAKLGFQISIP